MAELKTFLSSLGTDEDLDKDDLMELLIQLLYDLIK